uniref:Sugar transporter SWEET1 n=1 Tax=viral metagenome TaxID=1070528 RepID=A0A6C0JMT9_9ZZZZ
MSIHDLKFLPYSATSLSIVARLIFMFLLYKNKSTNSLSLLFCLLNMASSSMWIYYSVYMDDLPMIVRSSAELSLLSLSSVYIIRNKLINYQTQILPS